jgi:hypothetical protein
VDGLLPCMYLFFRKLDLGPHFKLVVLFNWKLSLQFDIMSLYLQYMKHEHNIRCLKGQHVLQATGGPTKFHASN